MSQPTAQAFLGVIIILVIAFVGFQLSRLLRPSTSKADTSASRLARNFQEMQHEGDIDTSELRKIETVLGKTHDTRPDR